MILFYSIINLYNQSLTQRLLILSFATIQSLYFYSDIHECTISTQKGWLANYQVNNTKLIISLNKYLIFLILNYPGFSQDRVNFHRNTGKDTAGRADPTWPNRAGYSIPCAVTLGSGGGKRGCGNSLAAWERAAPVRSGGAALWVVRFVLCFLLICIVVVIVPFVCFSVKLPLSRPTSFSLFLSILLRTPAVGGAAAWRFCCWPQPNQNNFKEPEGKLTILSSPPTLRRALMGNGATVFRMDVVLLHSPSSITWAKE